MELVSILSIFGFICSLEIEANIYVFHIIEANIYVFHIIEANIYVFHKIEANIYVLHIIEANISTINSYNSVLVIFILSYYITVYKMLSICWTQVKAHTLSTPWILTLFNYFYFNKCLINRESYYWIILVGKKIIVWR